METGVGIREEIAPSVIVQALDNLASVDINNPSDAAKVVGYQAISRIVRDDIVKNMVLTGIDILGNDFAQVVKSSDGIGITLANAE